MTKVFSQLARTAVTETQRDACGFVPVGGLEMYCEIHGTGQPLVLLHGAFSTIETSFGAMLPALAASHRVIALEFQGHGHTPDIDRALTYEQLADDVAALLSYFRLERTDVFGYSLGAGATLQLALRHPDCVRNIIVASGSYRSEGLYPEILATLESLTPEAMMGTVWHEAYLRVAPYPEGFRSITDKIFALDRVEQAWSASDMRSICAPALVIVADGDVVRPEHAVELFRLLEDRSFIAPRQRTQLAILPGTNHENLVTRADWLVTMVNAFLEV